MNCFPPPPSLESSFLRFRELGDRDALGAVFEVAAPVLALRAARWCQHQGEVDDLVQETFVRAMRGAAGYDEGRPLMAWLHGILRRVAWEHARHRTTTLEHDVAADAAHHDDDATLQLVAAAVATLPGGYRELLRRRILDGQRAVDIAAELHLPIATVRSKLQRGLRLLRQALPYGIAGGVWAAFAPTLLAAAWRRVARGTGAEPPRARWYGVGTAVLAAGLATVCVTLLGATDPTTSAGAVTPAPLAASTRRAPADEVTTAPRVAIAPASRAVRGSIDFGTVYHPMAAHVLVLPAPADFVLPPPMALALQPTATASVRAALHAPRERALARLALQPDGSFAGDVPTTACLLVLDDERAGLLRPALVPAAGAPGALDLGVLPGYVGRRVIGAVPAGLGITRVSLHADTTSCSPFDPSTFVATLYGAQRDVPIADDDSFVVPAAWPDGELLATATDAMGRTWWATCSDDRIPAARFQPAHGQLHVALRSGDLPPAGELELQHHGGIVTRHTVDAAERLVTGLVPGAYSATWRGPHGMRVVGTAHTAAGASLQLDGGARRRVDGRVVDDAGQPIARAMVLAADPGRPEAGPAAETESDADGRFTLAVPRGAWLFAEASHGRFACHRPGARCDVTLRVDGLRTVHGRLADPPASPAAFVAALLPHAAGPDQQPPAGLGTFVADDGAFHLTVPARRGQLHLVFADHTVATATLTATTTDLGALTVEPPRMLRGHVEDEWGRPCPDVLVTAAPADLEPSRVLRIAGARSDANGAFGFAVPAGVAVDVVATGARGRGHVRLDVAPDAAAVRLVLQATGTLRGTVTLPGAAGEVVLQRGEFLQRCRLDARGAFAVGDLPAGDYRVSYAAPGDGCTVQTTATVAAGAVSDCTLATSGTVAVVIELPADVTPPADALLLVRPADESHAPITRPLVTTARLELHPGDWIVQATTAALEPLGLATALRVDATAPARLRLQLAAADLCGRVVGAPADDRIVVSAHAPGTSAPAFLTMADGDGAFRMAHVDGSQVVLLATTAAAAPCFAVARGSAPHLVLRPAAWLERPAGQRPELVLERVDGLAVATSWPVPDGAGDAVPLPAGRLELRCDGRRHVIEAAPGGRVRLP